MILLQKKKLRLRVINSATVTLLVRGRVRIIARQLQPLSLLNYGGGGQGPGAPGTGVRGHEFSEGSRGVSMLSRALTESA